MYYKLKRTDLNDLFKVDDIDLNVDSVFVKKYVDEGDVFKKDTDDFKTEQEKKIAYLIINHDEIFVEFKSTTEVENKLHLMAALLTDASEITIKIPNVKLQEDFKKQYFIKETEFRENNELSINEKFLIGLTKDGWDNKEFIIKKLESFKDSYGQEENNKQLAVELVSYIPEVQWSDEDFIDKFITNKNIDKIIDYALKKEKNKTCNILYNEKILEKTVEFKNKFILSHYINVYSELKNENSYGNSSVAKDRNNNPSDELVNKEKTFMKIIEKYFTNVDYAKKIIRLVSEDNFYLFDTQLRKDKEFKENYITLVLESLEKKSKSSSAYIWNFTRLIGVDSFSDKRVQEFAIKNGNIIHDKEHEPLLAAEIVKNSPEEIANMLSMGKGIEFIWDYLSKEQKQEKIIAEEMIKQNPKIYNKLNESLRLDKEIFKSYYTELANNKLLKDFKVGKISKEFFDSFSEDEIIDLISIVSDFLLEEKFPQHYFDNMKVMSYANIDYHVFNTLYNENTRAKTTLEKIFKDKELSMNMLERQYNVFSFLSEELRSDMEILEKYVLKSYHYENLPKKVYLNKNLLLHIIKSKPNFVEKIPPEFFKDQNFLLRIFEKIDKKELNEQILHSLPTVINEILNTNPLKVGEYYQFFSNTFANMNLTQKLEPGKNLKVKKVKI